MKTNSRNGSAAFTLIELMAVITIIVILAGLVVGGLGYVSEKQARSKAQVQIALLSKSLEEYKLDNGTYPATGNFATPTTVSASTAGNTTIVSKALYYDGAADATKTIKIYLSDLDPLSSKQGWTTTTSQKILDPWGNEYLYRTAKTAAGVANTNAQNPDFDLWSVGKDSKSNSDLRHKDCRDDVRNF